MNTPLHEDRWCITLAVLAAWAVIFIGGPVLTGIAAVVTGEIEIGGGHG